MMPTLSRAAAVDQQGLYARGPSRKSFDLRKVFFRNGNLFSDYRGLLRASAATTGVDFLRGVDPPHARHRLDGRKRQTSGRVCYS